MSRLGGPWLALAAALLPSQIVRAQEVGASCEPKDLTALAGWSGVWLAEGAESDINGRELPGSQSGIAALKLIGLDAPWNDKGWARMEKFGGLPDGTGPQSGLGYPVMMGGPSPFTIIVSPSQTVIIGEYREVRYIFTDGRGHLPGDVRWPTIWGDSVGCWEDDTLTVETLSVQFSPDFSLFSPPLSENARFIERLRLTAPGRLESSITITDPETLERPWTVHMVYLRHPVIDRLIHEGHMLSNNRIVAEEDGLAIAPPKPAPAPRKLRESARLNEAELDRVVGTYTFDNVPFELTLERRGERMFYRVDPPQPFALPIHPADPLHYFSRMHTGVFNFVADADGKVIGFTGTSPDGDPISGKRKLQ